MKKAVFFLLFVIVFLGGFLRFYNIQNNPPGLYVDEVSIGLNAYDVLKTGKDQYNVYHPLFFAALGEYKMPVYIYLTSASMELFGKNEFSIRFPSAFFGTLTIFIFFFLSKELFKKIPIKKYSDWLALFTGFTLAISTWHIHFSRAGFEATVALFFYSLSILLFFYFLRNKKWILIFFSCLSLVITFYTYDGYRFLVPLTIIAGVLTVYKNKKLRLNALIVAIIFVILSLPLIWFTLTSGGLIRFQQTSAFYPPNFVNPWQNFAANIIIFLKNYLSYFSFTFLFRFGDQINRHQIQGWGLLYLWQLPYVILGLIFSTKTESKFFKRFIFFLLFSMPILPALTKPSPHTLRFLYGLIPFTFLTVIGFYSFINSKFRFVKLVLCITGVLIVLEFVYYLDYYFIHYPKESLIDWGGACKKVSLQLTKEQKHYKKIFIDEKLGCISSYYSFFIPNLSYSLVSSYSGIILTKEKTLFVTSSKKQEIKGQHLYDIHLENLNNDVFAQFWEL